MQLVQTACKVYGVLKVLSLQWLSPLVIECWGYDGPSVELTTVRVKNVCGTVHSLTLQVVMTSVRQCHYTYLAATELCANARRIRNGSGSLSSFCEWNFRRRLRVLQPKQLACVFCLLEAHEMMQTREKMSWPRRRFMLRDPDCSLALDWGLEMPVFILIIIKRCCINVLQ
jgi:hypothetical protein